MDEELVEEPVSTLLEGYADADLHQGVVEALKRLARAADEHARAVRCIVTQTLQPLNGLGDVALDQANAVRRLYGLPEAGPL